MNLSLLSYPTDPAILAAMPSLTGIYLIALIVGGGLLIISTFFGGDSDADVDADFDADLDVDVDADLDVDADVGTDVDGIDADTVGSALSLSTWFSIRFLVFFLAMFGLVGTVLSYMSTMSAPVVLASAAAAGLLVGQLVHQLFRYLKRSSVPGVTSIQDYVNKPARVTIAIHPPARGEVAIQVGQGERFVAARAKRSGEHFDLGQPVAVVEFRSGTALVVSQKEFEFLKDS